MRHLHQKTDEEELVEVLGVPERRNFTKAWNNAELKRILNDKTIYRTTRRTTETKSFWPTGKFRISKNLETRKY